MDTLTWDRLTVIGVVTSMTALLFVVELVRRRKLREDYSLLWLATAISLLVLIVFRPLLDGIASFLGVVTYPPAAVFAVVIAFMLLILLHFSTVITRLARENKQIAQQMAILRWELTELRRAAASDDDDGAGDDQDEHQGDAVNG